MRIKRIIEKDPLPDVNLKKIRQDPKTVEKMLNSLSLKDQLRAVLLRRPRERFELIQLSSKAKALVRLLPPQELYFTIKEIGEEDALPLLNYAHHSQLTYIFDIEFWKEQELAPSSVLNWIKLLSSASIDRFQEWLKDVDPELLYTILAKLVRVYVVDPEAEGNEPWRELEPYTLDGSYFFEILVPEETETVQKLLINLRDVKKELYYAILDEVRFSIPTELEDTAYRVRQGRLEDYGFYPFEDALKIYSFIGEKQRRELSKKYSSRHYVKEEPPRYALSFPGMGKLLETALSLLDDDEVEEFYHEFARIANKLIIADSMDLTDIKTIQRAVEKAFNYINIGVEVWVGQDVRECAKLISEQYLEHIFQVGYSEVIMLHRRALKIKREEWVKALFEMPFYLYPEPLGPTLEGLLKNRPLFYDPTGSKKSMFREFRNISEIREAQKIMDKIETINKLLFNVLGLNARKLIELKKLLNREPDFFSLILTFLVQGAIKEKPSFDPLSKKELCLFIQREMVGSLPRKIRAILKEEMSNWLINLSSNFSLKEPIVEELIKKAFEIFEEEVGHIEHPESFDPRFLSCVMVLEKEGA